ncbi:MAG TPA: CHC2 zinc finger domain-containing protein [Pyrinomonadaceae bacterium]|nr:CHC2 zinc finger domain-containing protein [Pyrinomonadaceae bacterium]
MEQAGRNLLRLRRLSEEVKSRLDYRSFYQRYCTDARVTSSRMQTLCPIPAHSHSGKGHPSLSIDLQRGLFHCFSRDEGGDAIRFYELMRNVPFSQAVREMAEGLGINASGQQSLAVRAAPDREPLEQPEAEPLGADRLTLICERFLEVCREEEQTEGLSYLQRRGIDAGTMRGAGVVYFPRRAYRRVMRRMLDAFALEELQRSGLFNAQAHLTFYRHRLLFPFYVEGRAVYLQARTTASGVEPRWHNMRGGVPCLYNMDALKDLPSGGVVYLVEGFTDTLTLTAYGFTAVGLVGAGGFREEWLAPLARFRVVAALDGDTAGTRATSRYREMFAARGMQLAHLDLPSDVNDFFQHQASGALEFTLLTEAALETMESRRQESEPKIQKERK